MARLFQDRTVTVGDRGFETGVVRIHWRPEAGADALFANLPTPFLAGAMHDDMIKTLPEVAVWLGHSDMYPHHAFRIGPCAWGVQFHPEVSPAGYREWVSARAETDPVTVRRMRRGAADFQRLDDDVVAGTAMLARRFADLVHALSVAGPCGSHEDPGVGGDEAATGPAFSPGPTGPGAGSARAHEPVSPIPLYQRKAAKT